MKAERVEIDADTEIRVLNGAHLTIEAGTLVLRGAVTIDGHGASGSDGRDGQGRGSLVIGGGDSKRLGQRCRNAHRDWENAGSHPDDRGGDGTTGGDGGDGASITIRYRSAEGSLDEIRTKLEGGAAGKGGRAGAGRVLICGCPVHKHPNKSGPSGSPGADGKGGQDGSFRVERVN